MYLKNTKRTDNLLCSPWVLLVMTALLAGGSPSEKKRTEYVVVVAVDQKRLRHRRHPNVFFDKLFHVVGGWRSGPVSHALPFHDKIEKFGWHVLRTCF